MSSSTYTVTSDGTIGEAEVTVEVSCADERFADAVLSELKGRAQELAQLADGTPPADTQRSVEIDWPTVLRNATHIDTPEWAAESGDDAGDSA